MQNENLKHEKKRRDDKFFISFDLKYTRIETFFISPH